MDCRGVQGKKITGGGEAELITRDCCAHLFGHDQLGKAQLLLQDLPQTPVLEMPSQQHVLGKGRTQRLHQTFTPRACPLETLPIPTLDPLAARKTSQAFLWEAEAWIWLRIQGKAGGGVQTKTTVMDGHPWSQRQQLCEQQLCWLSARHQCATASQGAWAPRPSSMGCVPGACQETGMARRQRYHLEPNWKGLKVKPA